MPLNVRMDKKKSGTFAQWTIIQLLKNDIMKYSGKWREQERNHSE